MMTFKLWGFPLNVWRNVSLKKKKQKKNFYTLYVIFVIVKLLRIAGGSAKLIIPSSAKLPQLAYLILTYMQ